MGTRGGSPDVLVAGGGVIGLACAWSLAQAGAEVTLLERGLPGGATSTVTGGGVRQLFSSELSIRLSRLSHPVWERFEEIFGVDPRFRPIGYLMLGRTDEHVEGLEADLVLQHELGVPSERLDRDALGRRWPGLGFAAHRLGVFCGLDGYLDQHAAVLGLYRGAVAAGARIVTGVDVSSLVRKGGRVVGVETSLGPLTAGTVLNALGPWAPRLAATAGVTIPMRAWRHRLVVAEPDPPLPAGTPWLYDLGSQVHARPDGTTRMLAGGLLRLAAETDPDTYERSVEREWIDQVLRAVADSFALPRVASARIVRSWAGVYASTPDAVPVIEESLPGLVTAAVFPAQGLMHAPAVGVLVRELVLGGAMTTLEPSQFSRARFGHTEPFVRGRF